MTRYGSGYDCYNYYYYDYSYCYYYYYYNYYYYYLPQNGLPDFICYPRVDYQTYG